MSTADGRIILYRVGRPKPRKIKAVIDKIVRILQQ